MKCARHPKRDAVAFEEENKKPCGVWLTYQVGMCKECYDRLRALQ